MEQNEREWHYSREGRPIVHRLDPRCPDYEWARGELDMKLCGCCRWFYKIEGTKRTCRCLCENRRNRP